MIHIETNQAPGFVRVPRTFNDPESKTFTAIVVPRYGKIVLFQGDEYDAVEEFTEEVITNKVKELINE